MSTIIKYEAPIITPTQISFKVGIPDPERNFTFRTINLSVGHLEDSKTTLEDDLKALLLRNFFHPEADITLQEVPHV